MASVAMGKAQPAQAAISCPALPVTGLPGWAVDNGTPCGTVDSTTGAQQFTVDYTAVIADPANVADFNLANYFSLQSVSINTGAGSTIGFSDVRFLVSGFIGATPLIDQSIAVWQDLATVQADPTSQGYSGYWVAEPVATAFGTNYKTASFFLTPGGVNVVTGLDAGLINTKAFQPSAFGMTALSSLKITGTITGGSIDGGAAAFGLANFQGYNTGDPFGTTPGGSVMPDTIFGRAVLVNQVPGPLPLFGAGAAFGWSRRLRRRIDSKTVAA
ncbi:MAG: hypothetical protein WAM11_00825 [Cyanobium sp.]